VSFDLTCPAPTYLIAFLPCRVALTLYHSSSDHFYYPTQADKVSLTLYPHVALSGSLLTILGGFRCALCCTIWT
jgi:hypothetical protein